MGAREICKRGAISKDTIHSAYFSRIVSDILKPDETKATSIRAQQVALRKRQPAIDKTLAKRLHTGKRSLPAPCPAPWSWASLENWAAVRICYKIRLANNYPPCYTQHLCPPRQPIVHLFPIDISTVTERKPLLNRLGPAILPCFLCLCSPQPTSVWFGI